jgi:hypothetical protein
MICVEWLRHPIRPLGGNRRGNEVTPLVARQPAEPALVLLARLAIERCELPSPAAGGRFTGCAQGGASVRMNEFHPGLIPSDPLRERATHAGESVRTQFAGQDNFGETRQHRSVEHCALLRRCFAGRPGFNRPRTHANAERGTKTAQPADETASGEHCAECTGRKAGHKTRWRRADVGWEMNPSILTMTLQRLSHRSLS